MDEAFNALFEDGDAAFRAKILRIPARTMRGLVREYIARINAHATDAPFRAQLKRVLTQYEEQWGTSVFTWDYQSGQFTMGIQHAPLEDRTSRYFQILCAIDEMAFPLGTATFDFWTPIRETAVFD